MGWVKVGNNRGPIGHSVARAFINALGRLQIILTNGFALDAGDARGPQGLPGPGAVPADEAVAGYISTLGASATKAALKAGYAPKDASFFVSGFGAAADGATDDRAAIQAAFDAAAANGGAVIFPAGAILKVQGSLRFRNIGNANVDVFGNGCTLLFDGSSTDPALWLEALSGNQIRRISVRDMRIQGDANWNSLSLLNRIGLKVGWAQDLSFSNVWVSQFKKGGLSLDQVWDTEWLGVQVVHCGYADSNTESAYAVQLSSTGSDNSNANHFQGLHIEQSALMLAIDRNSRHNHFSDVKFETGTAQVNNTAGRAPIRLSASIENSFVNGHFTKNLADNIAFVSSNDTNYESSEAAQLSVKRFTSFVGCAFTSHESVSSRWFSGSDVRFTDSVFGRTLGDLTTAAFTMAHNVAVRGCVVTFAAGSSGLFDIAGSNSTVDDVTVYCANSGNSGSIITLRGGARRTVVTDSLRVIGVPERMMREVTVTDRDANSISGGKARKEISIAAANLGASAFGASVLAVTATAAGSSIGNLESGFPGSAVMVVNVGTISFNLNTSANLRFKSGSATLPIAAGAWVRMVYVGTFWYEA